VLTVNSVTVCMPFSLYLFCGMFVLILPLLKSFLKTEKYKSTSHGVT
jgi:hypothetical protein